MNAKSALHILVIASDHSLANPLISELRQNGLTVSASNLAKISQSIHQLNTRQAHLVLLIQSKSHEAAQCSTLFTTHNIRTPLLLTFAGGLANATAKPILMDKDSSPDQLCDVIPLREKRRLIDAITLHASLYQSLKRNRILDKQTLILEKQQQALLNSSTNGIAFLKQDRHLFCNDRYAAVFSCDDKEKLLTNSIFDLVDAQSRGVLGKHLSGKIVASASLLVKRKNSHEMIRLSFQAGIFDRQTCVQVSASQAKGNEQYANEKQTLANQDLLTRLDNIEHFTSRIDSAIAQAISKQIVSVLLLVHIEQFREFQETIGKTGTNQLLYEISEFLGAAISTPFTASRLADNEFGLLLYDSDPNQGIELARYLHNKLNRAHSRDKNESVAISASLGLALINEFSLDAEDMIKRARLNRVSELVSDIPEKSCLFKDNSNIKSQDLTGIIRHALKNQGLELLFQALVPFQPDALERYELSTRLKGESGEILMPADFLGQANMHNLADALDQQVLEFLFQNQIWHKNCHLRLYIPVSGNTLVSSNMLSWISKKLRLYKFPAHQLVFQISEIDLHSNWQQSLSFCRSLDELGIRKAITRFGSAMEPLTVLSALKPDAIWLDATLSREFIYGKAESQKIRNMIKAIHLKHVSVCVSGMEDLDLLPALWILGVDFIQGDIIQAPAADMHYRFPKEVKISC